MGRTKSLQHYASRKHPSEGQKNNSGIFPSQAAGLCLQDSQKHHGSATDSLSHPAWHNGLSPPDLLLVQHKPLPALGPALGLSSSSYVMQQRDTQTGWYNSKELVHLLQHLVMETRDCPNTPDVQTSLLILPEACWRGWQPTALPNPAQAGPEKPSTRCPTKTDSSAISERALSQQPGPSTGNRYSYLQMDVAEHPQPGCWLWLSR